MKCRKKSHHPACLPPPRGAPQSPPAPVVCLHLWSVCTCGLPAPMVYLPLQSACTCGPPAPVVRLHLWSACTRAMEPVEVAGSGQCGCTHSPGEGGARQRSHLDKHEEDSSGSHLHQATLQAGFSPKKFADTFPVNTLPFHLHQRRGGREGSEGLTRYK